MVQAGDERIAAGTRQPAVRGFQAEHPAQRGGHTDGTVGVRTQGQWHLASGHCRATAAGRSARDAAEVVRVVRRADVAVLGGEAVGVLVHVERADQHRAGLFQPAHQQRVRSGRRGLAFDLRAGQRRQPRDVEQVLDRERHSQQRQLARARPRRAGQRSVHLGRPPQGAVAQHVGEGVHLAVGGGDAVQRGLHQGRSADLAVAHGLRHGRTIAAQQLGGAHVPGSGGETGTKVVAFS